MKQYKKLFFTNTIILLYFIMSFIIEFTGIYFVNGKFYISNPIIYLTMVLLGCVILYAIKNQTARIIVSTVFLVLNIIIDAIFITISAMTSGTIFDFPMINLASDGMGVAEKLVINYPFLIISILITAIYFVVLFLLRKKIPAPKKYEYSKIITIVLACVFAFSQGMTAFSFSYNKKANVEYLLYKNSANDYSENGILGNLINETYKGAFLSSVKVGDEEELKSFIYDKVYPQNETDKTEMFGVAKGYNVIVILCESFEWFTFLNDLEKFPNGHTANEETLKILFPNLYDIYNNSYVLDNYHSREKTDISEDYTILGNYPLEAYINYDFEKNSLPYSVPNTLNTLNNTISKSFHNGTANFYNRTNFLTKAAGFESFTASDKMNITDYTAVGERNLDSEMIDACKEEMFPTNRTFSTYITTITGHGQYAERENLSKYYELMDKYNVCPIADNDAPDKTMSDMFRYYVATGMELDCAIGKINDYLKANGLYDNTVLAMYGDHNAYYSDLSAYVKDLPTPDTEKNYVDLFRVPFMMRIGNQNKQIKIDKFTTNSDIVPTLYDILGIKYFSNLFYGHSIFSAETSVLYSRAYEVFITDKMYFYSLNRIIYKDKDTTEEYINQIENDSKILLNKISHINRIFYNDFLSNENKTEFNNKLIEINS